MQRSPFERSQRKQLETGKENAQTSPASGKRKRPKTPRDTPYFEAVASSPFTNTNPSATACFVRSTAAALSNDPHSAFITRDTSHHFCSNATGMCASNQHQGRGKANETKKAKTKKVDG
jgi:hypothetical protein